MSVHVAPDVPADLSSAAIRSCNTALGTRQCRLEDAESRDAEWQATVSASDSNLDSVRIELKRRAGGAAPEMRELSFGPEDAPRERWASIGVLIAALVVAASRELEPEPPPAPAAPPHRVEPVQPRPVKIAPAPPRVLRFDFRGLATFRTAKGPPEVGAEMGASFIPNEGPWFLGGAVSGARRLGADPGVSWVSAALALGVRVGGPSATIGGEFRGGLAGEYWLFDASEPTRSEVGGRFRMGGLVGADFLWAVHRRWILSLGVEGLLVTPRVTIDVEGRSVERIREYGAILAAGIRFFP